MGRNESKTYTVITEEGANVDAESHSGAGDQRARRRRRLHRIPGLTASAAAMAAPQASFRRRLTQLAVVVLMVAFAALAATVQTAFGSTVSSAAFTGGAGTVSVSGTLYAKSGGALTLTVNTSSDTKCVDVTGAHTGHQTSSTAKSTWTFSFTAGAGNGVQTVTAAASPNFNASNCTGQSQSPQNASYVLDNTGPVVTGVVAPVPNAAGWNKDNVSITWSATDAGSGVSTGPTPPTDSQNSNTTGVTKTSTATDRLGNSGTGSVSVKLDKMPPNITGSRNPAANANGWNNSDVTASFICSDGISGIKSCSGPTTFTTNAANQSVTGSAVDNADNSASTTVSNINIDKVAPTLSGAPTTSPNGAGWYKSNVAIHWTANDALSGLAGSAPADSTISSEGTGLTASASVSDKAGNTTNATSSPAVKIDKTAPNTTATAPADWNNTDVTVSLNASDALSGVASTFYRLDLGAIQVGSSVAISTEADHTLEFWSVDNAGNAETAKSVHVKIDKTPPTINHTQSPAANVNGWNSSDVTVTFTCADALSGVASCTSPQTVTTEGQSQSVVGTALDNAGNSATDPATVSIDKTAPAIDGGPDRPANSNGWYNADVTFSFTCSDALSGLASCTSPQLLGEGANQTVLGNAQDAAGNTASKLFTGVNVDETAPELSGAATTSPNANGWYSGDIVVHWTASDALSGLNGASPDDSTITGEGDNLSASASVSDKADNPANATVSGIKIDRTAPSTLVSVPAPLESGWYAGDVLVTLATGADLSGVDKTYYSVDGGAAQVYGGPFSHTLKGSHTITFWSVDMAGNVEDKTASGHELTLKIDGVPPTITGSRLPLANGFGWNNVPVTATFSCSDAESGIAGCSDPVVFSNEGAGQSATGLAQDNAGNTASATVTDVNIDLTAPTLTSAAATTPNAFGWYKGDVTIHWTGQDGLSGIDPSTQPADSVITGQGASLGAGPALISDKAGNVGSGSVSGIQIDRTPPTISGATVNDDGTLRSPNGSGWFNSAVRVRFACSDALSTVQECASDVVLSSDGTNQSASGNATDKADNAASATVSGIKIDSQAPQTNSDLQCTKKNGFCRGNKATVALAATDQAGLSGVKEIRYSINNGSTLTSAGASASVDVPLNGSGHATVAYQAVDNAGNMETPGAVEIDYDTIAPTVTHTLNPPANAAGWDNANTTVHFNAQDDPGGSGLDVGTVTADQTISTETSGTVVLGSADDLAGNTGTDSVTVKLDKTMPTITGAATTSPNANGWYNGPVTVHYTCSDVLSGIATCPANDVLSANGANQSSTGTAKDRADNSASATVSGINIDSLAPTITVNGIANGGVYTLGAVPAASCTASDGGAGLDGGCSVNVSGGQANGVGTFTFTATAKDLAGNTTTQTGSYKVIYRFDGFLQPINDTAHQIDQGVSVFKAGSTVPVKFQLKKADGTVVQSNTLPAWLNPAKGSPTTAPVDEILYSDPATSGNTYRWDGTAQYIYNWGTAKNQVGYFWRIGVTLDDGQTYFVSIGLR
jgi:hypothetical protein